MFHIIDESAANHMILGIIVINQLRIIDKRQTGLVPKKLE
jgi:hypothetical protein